MCYTNAPATQLLATHCCACGRPLVDAVSVETGIGPVCRERYMHDDENAENRDEANKLVHEIAALQDGPEVRVSMFRLRELGFNVLADRLAERLAGGDAAIKIETHEDRGRTFLAVTTPFSRDALNDWRAIPGCWWHGDTKRRMVPVAQKAALWKLLKKNWTGFRGESARGPFVVG